MKIEKLRVNHIEHPLGYQIEAPVFSWCVSESTGKRQGSARIKISKDKQMKEILFDTGEKRELCSLGEEVDIPLLPRTRYYWCVSVTADDGDTGISEVSWFETGKQQEIWDASWIKAAFELPPVMYKTIRLGKKIAYARLYICGLGLYEAEINGNRIGDSFLTPGFDSYQAQIQYQTYDVTNNLKEGENVISVKLGDGWYLGRFGFGDVMDENLYGNCYQLLAELHIFYSDGTEEVIGTDKSWLCAVSPVQEGNIYDGEVYDARLEGNSMFMNAVLADPPEGRLTGQIGPPVKIGCTLRSYKLICSPIGEWILDFGQNISGWVTFTSRLPEERRVVLQYGEILQNGCFCRDNLRTAKQEYIYTANGDIKHMRPCFTVYGFRYVKVEGMSEEEIRNVGFAAEAVWSDMDQIGEIETSDQKINQLLQNTLWSQRSNFVDIPTDCPQRDERMGWTGDAQAFSGTACYNMYTPAFYHKYLSDMLAEQQELNGSVPFVVPDIYSQYNRKTGYVPSDRPFDKKNGSCGWGDAATVIPWNLYQFYGDKSLLRCHYPNMKLWIDYIRKQDDGRRLWETGFHFADWLALDRPDPNHSMGGTDPFYVASAYYYLSARLTAKAAGVLGETSDEKLYGNLADEIRAAMQKKYFSADGRLLVDTQTAHVLALNLDIVSDKYRETTAEHLCRLIRSKGNHLDTGFVGTYQICPALSKSGRINTAYCLLFNEDYPSWLYQVNMGATTIWERWDSILPDGTMSGSGMNSLNHYANGSVVQWIYETVIGLRPLEPGFAKAVITPHPTKRLSYARCRYDSAAGRYEIGWEYQGDKVCYTLSIPFGAEAKLSLPGSGEKIVLEAGNYTFTE